MQFHRRVFATLNAKLDLATPDNKPVKSVYNCRLPGVINAAKVHVDIAHANVSQLKIELITPWGETVTLHNRQGLKQANMVHTFQGHLTQSLNNHEAEGAWTLQVTDFSFRDGGGTLKAWKFEAELHRDAKGREIFKTAVNANLGSGTHYPVTSALLVDVDHSTLVINGGNMHVEIDHDRDFINDMGLTLKAPSGKTYSLNVPEGWVKRGHHWTLDAHRVPGLSDETVRGTWQLLINDPTGKARGRVNSWRLSFYDHKVFRQIADFPNDAERILHHHGISSMASLKQALPLELSSILAMHHRKDAVDLGRRLTGT